MPIGQATAEPASAIQATPHRRVSSARIENPTLNTRVSQVNTRDGRAIASRMAASSPIEDVEPPRVTGVRVGRTTPGSRRPGSRRPKPLHQDRFHRATRRSASSMSPLNSSKSAVAAIGAASHPQHPFADGGGRGARRCVGIPSPTSVLTRRPASCASPAVVRRWPAIVGVGDEVVRRSAGDRGGDDVAGPDVGARQGRSAPAGRRGPARTSSRCCSVLAALAGGDEQFDRGADLGGVLLQGDSLLQFDQAHDSVPAQRLSAVGRAARPPGCRAAWSTGT